MFPIQVKIIKHIGVFLLLIGVSLFITILFPVYFRNDDGTGLYWAVYHNLLDAFSTNVATIGGTYRPMNYIFWWIMYHLFGHNQFYYQFIVVLIFLCCFYFFYLICKTYYGNIKALVILLLHISLFNNLYYVAFWFSDTSFTLQLLFVFISILFYLRSKTNSRYIYISYLFFLFSVLTKEPSIIILISFVLSDLLINKEQNASNKRYLILLPYVLISTIILYISPVLARRPVAFNNFLSLSNKIDFRINFYYEYLLSGNRIIIPVLFALITFYTIDLRKIWMKIIPLTLVIPVYFNAYYFFTYIAITSLLMVKNNIALLSSFVWFQLTVIPLFFLGFYTPTYLFEFSFGFSMFMGITMHDNYENIRAYFIKFKYNVFAKILLMIILLVSTGLIIQQIKSQVEALNKVVEVRQNFAAAMEYIQNHKNNISQIVVIDQKLIGDLKNKTHKLTDHNTKSTQQQTMSAQFLKNYIKSLKLTHIKCVKYTKYMNSKELTSKSILLLQNNKDITGAKNLGLIKDTLFIYSHYGHNYTLICSFKQNE